MDTEKFKEFKRVDIMTSEGELLLSSGDIRPDSEKVILFGHDFKNIELQTGVKAVGYAEDGLVNMDAMVTMSTERQVNIVVLSEGEQHERRNSLKVKVTMELNVHCVRSSGKKKRKLYRLDEIVTKDLSMGGICFISGTPYFKNQELSIDLGRVKPGLMAQTLILRKSRIKEPGYRFKYGGKFLGLNTEEERVLCEFIFKQQLLNYRKEQDLRFDK